MAEFIFACPSCHREIACDDAWTGHPIQCPLCNASIVVPSPKSQATENPLVPKPPSSGGKLRMGAAPSKQAAAAGEPERVIPIRNLAPEAKKKQNPLLKILKVVVILAALGVGGYFGYGFVMDYQNKVNEKRRAEEKNADGGQVGHIADLHDALDRTDPDRGGLGESSAATGPSRRESATPREIAVPADAAGTNAPEKKLPIIPPIHTLVLEQAKIPEGRVNGSITGTNFVPEIARVDQVGTAQVFRLTQGSPASPDGEILVYLHLKAGEKVGGQKISITPDQRGTAVPQVAKRWKPNPKYAPQMKSFAFGYAMKLEFGTATNGALPGKIYLALPDNEQSVVAGVFSATGGLVEGASPDADTAGAEASPQRNMSPEFQRRYGIRR